MMIKEKIFLLAMAAFTVGLSSFYLLNHFDDSETVEPPAAAAYVPQTRAYEVTCGSTATSIKPSEWSTIHSVTCSLSKESPDDSAECACIGSASDLDQDTKCYPIGGCARAVATSIAIDGNADCLREDASDVVLVCLAGRGQP